MTQTNETEAAFLGNDDPDEFEHPLVLVDTVIFTVIDKQLHVLIIKRSDHPFKGSWSLVGGFIDVNQDIDIEATANRKLFEKTGLKTPYLEQFGSIGNAKRDPRGWSVTHVYFSLVAHEHVRLCKGAGASDIQWASIDREKIAQPMAFDHSEILAKCIKRLRNKVLYTNLPVHLMAKQFTLRELQTVYEIILNYPLEHKSFRRRILSADIIEETGKMCHERGRPAKLYKATKEETYFFIRNIESFGR